VISMISQNSMKQLDLATRIIYGLSFDKREVLFSRETNGERIDWNQILLNAKNNRISTKIFKKATGVPKDVESAISEAILEEEMNFKNLADSFVKACKLFNDSGVNYVVVKSFKRFPFCIISDFDLIIPGEFDRRKALGILKGLGYHFVKGITCEEPYKCSCVKGNSQIDIYPRAAWNRMKVLDTDLLVERKKQRVFYGLNVYSPSSEDDLLILASHSFAHRIIKLSEVFEALEVLKEDLDWKYVISMARKYGTVHCLYYFLLVVQSVCNSIKQDVNLQLLKLLENDRVARVTKIVKSRERPLLFPQNFPSLLVFVSITYRAFLHIEKGDFKDLIDDISSHSLMTVLHFMECLKIDLKHVVVPRQASYRI